MTVYYLLNNEVLAYGQANQFPSFQDVVLLGGKKYWVSEREWVAEAEVVDFMPTILHTLHIHLEEPTEDGS